MTNLQKHILILGTGTFAQEIADVVSEAPGICVDGFVENMDKERCRETCCGLPVYWVDRLADFAHTHFALLGLGTTKRRLYAEQAAQFGIPFAAVVHPSAQVSSKGSIGPGTFISRSAIVSAYTQLGEHVVVNRAALIGHHTQVDSFVTVGPNANIAGNCRIETGVYIGMSAAIVDHVSVGAHSVIAAGAVVVKALPAGVMAAGVPARIIKHNVDGR